MIILSQLTECWITGVCHYPWPRFSKKENHFCREETSGRYDQWANMLRSGFSGTGVMMQPRHQADDFPQWPKTTEVRSSVPAFTPSAEGSGDRNKRIARKGASEARAK